jgi:hypothetical protein
MRTRSEEPFASGFICQSSLPVGITSFFNSSGLRIFAVCYRGDDKRDREGAPRRRHPAHIPAVSESSQPVFAVDHKVSFIAIARHQGYGWLGGERMCIPAPLSSAHFSPGRVEEGMIETRVTRLVQRQSVQVLLTGYFLMTYD